MNTKVKLKAKDYLSAIAMMLSLFAVIVCFVILKYTFGGAFSAADNKNFGRAFGGALLGLFLILITFFTYVIFSRKKLLQNLRFIAIMCITMVFVVGLCLLLSTVSIYYMPIALAAFILVFVCDKRDVFIANTVSVLFVFVIMFFEYYLGDVNAAVGEDNIISLVLVTILGISTGSLAAYSMVGSPNRFSYVIRGLIISAIYFAIMFVYSFLNTKFVFKEHYIFILISALGQLLFAFMIQPVTEKVFNILTNFRLSELTDHNNPLLKRLIEEAPGTFNHSLSVASFVEMCAINIGENPYLAKACAYYHDIGKLSDPTYFAENQSGYNPHDELLPEVSAAILRKHTTYGYELCTKYNIPEEIKHVTLQHHGTLPMTVFYEKAKKLTDGDVDVYEYSYHGQTPVTKIAAIIMICDAAEAAIRAMANPSASEVDTLISNIINARIELKQFDACDITMRDLKTIKQTIMNIYGGLFHERIKYPDPTVKD